MSAGLPHPLTKQGEEGLAALQREPGRALVAMDYDGTLSPIVTDPRDAHPQPDVLPTMRKLAGLVGTLAVITGRPAAAAVELGGLDAVPGLIVLGHYGWERWQGGSLASPPPPPGVTTARDRLPGVLAGAGAPEGTWVEDKGHALAVHTRRTADPAAALDRLAGPLAVLAASAGLVCEPGRLVIELRPRGIDKGSALEKLVAERGAGPLFFAGDDLGDLAAFAAVRALRESGHPGVTVCSASEEVTELAAQADLIVEGPEGFTALLGSLVAALESAPQA